MLCRSAYVEVSISPPYEESWVKESFPAYYHFIKKYQSLNKHAFHVTSFVIKDDCMFACDKCDKEQMI